MAGSETNHQRGEPSGPPATERGGIYGGEIPVYGVDYQEDGIFLSQNAFHSWIICRLRDDLEQHRHWFAPPEKNTLLSDVLIVYRVEGEIVTVAPDTMLTKGHALSEGAYAYVLPVEGRPPNFALDVVSSTNTPQELATKHREYRRIGIPEYFVYDVCVDPHPDAWVPTLKRYTLLPGGEAWEETHSRTTLRSRQLETDILIDGWELALINPHTGKRYLSVGELCATRPLPARVVRPPSEPYIFLGEVSAREDRAEARAAEE